ncbi:MAG: hypothetical protein AB1647_13355 [Pseudomonadota bacterium]
MTDQYLLALKWLSPAAKTRAGDMVAEGGRAAARPGMKAPEGELDAFLFEVGRSRGNALMVVDSVARALDAAGDLAPARAEGAMETDRGRTFAERIEALVAKAREGERLHLQSLKVRDAMQEGDGLWRSCSGCYETNEGYPTAPTDPGFGVPLGVGCGECGGIGAVWDTTDYAALGDALAAKEDESR